MPARKPMAPATIRISPTVERSTPEMLSSTAKRRIAPTATRNIEVPIVTIPWVPRFWIYMQIVIVICVVASMVIAVIKL